MKKIIIALAFLLPFSLSAAEKQKPIVIDSDVLRFIDGTPFIDIAQILHFGHQIRVLQNGEKDEKSGKLVGILTYKSERYTLKQLVELEKTLLSEARSFKEVLNEAISYFEKVSIPYLDEAKGSKHYMIDLIQKWSRQRHKPSTPLLEWSKLEGSEQEAFRRNVKTCTHLDEFCDDLTLFLIDLIRSCEKSWKQYRLLLKEMQQKQ